MPSDVTGKFEDSLGELAVNQTRTTTERFQNVLTETVVEPAVGSFLPIEDIALDKTPVTTNPTPEELDEAQTGVTVAELGIGSYGTLVIKDTPDGAESVSLFPDLHVAVVQASDIVESMPAAFERLGPLIREEGSSAILETGPSATADMGALVRGAHGPETVHVIIITDR